ncbi:MAG: hypothetical protein F2667_03500 [Actinobacteria bacterium]|uniref:Unannotated protein n=1 Tax=freshwater metagenome TaxID=449393 RepID=A0A6J6PGR0_9ZZZZ|nr:hypothetical protein [Actinomycetota bacterium]
MPVDPEGTTGPTKGQARGPTWRRTTPGLYVPASVDAAVVEQRIREQSMRLTSGAVTGWAALRLHGGGFFDGLGPDGRTVRPVPVVVGGDRIRPCADIHQSRHRLRPHEVVVRHGIRCTTPERAVIDEIRRLDDVREGVVTLDMACAARLTSISRVRTVVLGVGGRRLDTVRTALGLAHERSRSPWESRLRLLWEIDLGWSRPLCNWAILDRDGQLLGKPDLLGPELGLVAEYDGALHRTRSRHRRDVRREEAFRRAGLEVVTFVAGDLDETAAAMSRLQAARERAGRPGTWVLGATPSPSLDELLDQRDWLRGLADDAS